MLLNIQTNFTMSPNKVAFKGKENFVNKVVRNFLYPPEDQAYAKAMLNSPYTTSKQNNTRLAYKLYTTSFRELIINPFKNLIRIFLKW